MDGGEGTDLRKEEERDVGVVPEVRKVRLEREETRGPIQVLVRREESRGCLHQFQCKEKRNVLHFSVIIEIYTRNRLEGKITLKVN